MALIKELNLLAQGLEANAADLEREHRDQSSNAALRAEGRIDVSREVALNIYRLISQGSAGKDAAANQLIGKFVEGQHSPSPAPEYSPSPSPISAEEAVAQAKEAFPATQEYSPSPSPGQIS